MVVVINGRSVDYGGEMNDIYYHLLIPIINNEWEHNATKSITYNIDVLHGDATNPWEKRLFNSRIMLDDNLLSISSIEVSPQGNDRVFVMTDKRGPLRAIAAHGEWRLTTNDERPIYIMECREPLVGIQRPFTSAATYAWQGDTLALRLDWLDGGDNRRMKIALAGDSTRVFITDNYDYLLTDTIIGTIQPRQ